METISVVLMCTGLIIFVGSMVCGITGSGEDDRVAAGGAAIAMVVIVIAGIIGVVGDKLDTPCPEDQTEVRHFEGYRSELVGKVVAQVPQYRYECIKEASRAREGLQ